MNIDENNMCIFVVNARLRVKPPLSPNYFGSFIDAPFNFIKVSELLGRSLMINPSTTNLFDGQIYYPTLRPALKLLLISGSHRKDVFGVDFGLGKTRISMMEKWCFVPREKVKQVPTYRFVFHKM
ncbi:LOW QUALITY PROTEIN: hypothetical protein V2J09_000175 [Rumex salicifolius]